MFLCSASFFKDICLFRLYTKLCQRYTNLPQIDAKSIPNRNSYSKPVALDLNFKSYRNYLYSISSYISVAHRFILKKNHESPLFPHFLFFLYPQQPDSWLNRLAVELVASKCMPEHGGDVIGWQDTPRRGYGGVLEATLQDLCQGRAKS